MTSSAASSTSRPGTQTRIDVDDPLDQATRAALRDELDARGHYDQVLALDRCEVAHRWARLQNAGDEDAAREIEDEATRWLWCYDCGEAWRIPDVSRLRLCPACMDHRRAQLRARYSGPIRDGLREAVRHAPPNWRIRHLVLTVRNPERPQGAISDLLDAWTRFRRARVQDAVDAVGSWGWYDDEIGRRRHPDHPAHHACRLPPGRTHTDPDECARHDPDAFTAVRWDDLFLAWVRTVEANYRENSGWNLHMHVLAVTPYIPQHVLSHAWFQATGDSDVVWIHDVASYGRGDDQEASLDEAIAEVTKYAAKRPGILEHVDGTDLSEAARESLARQRAARLVDWWEATRERRLVTTGGWIHGNSRVARMLLQDLVVRADDEPATCPECGSTRIGPPPEDGKDPPEAAFDRFDDVVRKQATGIGGGFA